VSILSPSEEQSSDGGILSTSSIRNKKRKTVIQDPDDDEVDEEEERGNINGSSNVEEPKAFVESIASASDADLARKETAKSQIVTGSTDDLTEERKIEAEETKEEPIDGLPQVEETKATPRKRVIVDDEDEEEEDSFVHCDSELAVGDEDGAKLTGQLP